MICCACSCVYDGATVLLKLAMMTSTLFVVVANGVAPAVVPMPAVAGALKIVILLGSSDEPSADRWPET